jgi:2-polyprenyl-3-methyl-5-hydroxy-6-metoxy-1,4-benzoquinol methylase
MGQGGLSLDMDQNDLLFDNSRFWDRRYRDDPALGSGIGSRGANLRYKQDIIGAFLERTRPESILDVGCGDHETLRAFRDLPGYLGIDVSAVVVAQNMARFPDRAFTHCDFIDSAEGAGSADAVLCMEVLIHQHRQDSYERMVRNLVAAAHKGGLVSGYLVNPRPAVRSDIIAWHEPLAETLAKAGARNIEIVGRSLEVDCLGFVAFER